MSRLLWDTPETWVEVVAQDVDGFLIDHAACERKASATAMHMVAHYADRPLLVNEMIELALEELEHFRQVYRYIEARGRQLGPDSKDVYVNAMRRLTRSGRDQLLLDRLLVAGAIEARGCERFGLLANHLPQTELRALYGDLCRAEARHHGLFIRLAREYFPDQEVDERAREIFAAEAEIAKAQPLRATLH